MNCCPSFMSKWALASCQHSVESPFFFSPQFITVVHSAGIANKWGVAPWGNKQKPQQENHQQQSKWCYLTAVSLCNTGMMWLPHLILDFPMLELQNTNLQHCESTALSQFYSRPVSLAHCTWRWQNTTEAMKNIKSTFYTNNLQQNQPILNIIQKKIIQVQTMTAMNVNAARRAAVFSACFVVCDCNTFKYCVALPAAAPLNLLYCHHRLIFFWPQLSAERQKVGLK